MKIFIISSVRDASLLYKQRLEDYVHSLEAEGHQVHLPHRDTEQDSTGLQICKDNREAITWADEVHIFYTPGSQGTHFDMGMAFAMCKPLVVVENAPYGEGKSFPRMLDEWERD